MGKHIGDYFQFGCFADCNSFLVGGVETARAGPGNSSGPGQRDRYTTDEEGTVVDNAKEELELIAVSKRPTRLLPHGTAVCTNLEPSVQEATPFKKIWCVKLMDDAHAPETMSGQLNVVKTYLKAR